MYFSQRTIRLSGPSLRGYASSLLLDPACPPHCAQRFGLGLLDVSFDAWLGLGCLVELVESVIFQRGNPQWLSILLFRDLTSKISGGFSRTLHFSCCALLCLSSTHVSRYPSHYFSNWDPIIANLAESDLVTRGRKRAEVGSDIHNCFGAI